jgi:hypothetical protein
MTRQAELDDLREQAVKHALIAERMGFIATAEALWSLAHEVEIERQEVFGTGLHGFAGNASDMNAASWTANTRLRAAAGG